MMQCNNTMIMGSWMAENGKTQDSDRNAGVKQRIGKYRKNT
jgi:hypothetical protein